MAADLKLFKSTAALVEQVTLETRHPSLQLDKFSPPGDMKEQKQTLHRVIKTVGDDALLEALLQRRADDLSALGAISWTCTTAGALTLHLSRASALENAGICLHPLYGFAYLPGSGLKGMARAYAETVWLKAQEHKVESWLTIEAVFGWAPNSDRGKEAWKPPEVPARAKNEAAHVGAVVFHDAWPRAWPRLVVDIANNHHAQYYAGEDAPGDWENPNPVYFLAVPAGETFSFALSPRRPGNKAFVPQARAWLTGALCHLGAGAKTNAGYGAFRLCDGEPPPLSGQARAAWSTTLELVTPAFLAGADQTAADCELRPASLRGLLRWWWRTLHAGFVDVNTLRAMEAAIWGNTSAGGAVRLTTDRLTAVEPERYAFKERFEPSQNFKKQHDLQSRPNQKTTQGLFYASYGMDEARKGQRPSRWFMPALTSWSVRLTARPARYHRDPKENNPIEIPADIVLDQAKAALSLLCRFGGIGSKARKGFGGFKDIDGLSIDECKQAARYFRGQCGLDERDAREAERVETPSLDHMLDPLEIETPWKDPWFALDQLGYAAQSFAQTYKHKEEKIALGLPRKIHGPRTEGPATRRDGTPVQDRWQPPEWLGLDHQKRNKNTDPDKFRDAAPVHYHLARSSNGTLTIRVTAFPSPYLPNHETSCRILGELLDHLRVDLGARIATFADKGQRLSKPPTTSKTSSSTRPAPPPKRGDRIKAVLLEEKTSKGGWKAKDEATGWVGYIHNTADVPGDANTAQLVGLIVDVGKERDFRLLWPTPDVEERTRKSLAPAPQKKNPPRRR